MCTTAFPLQLFPFILYSFSTLPLHHHFLLRHTIANAAPPNHFHTFNSLMLSVSPTSRSFFQTVSWYSSLSFPLSSTILSVFCLFVPKSLHLHYSLAFNMAHLGIYHFFPPSLSFTIPIPSLAPWSLPCCKISLWSEFFSPSVFKMFSEEKARFLISFFTDTLVHLSLLLCNRTACVGLYSSRLQGWWVLKCIYVCVCARWYVWVCI